MWYLTGEAACRFVLANTEALHEKIQTLANRVRELEDALEVAHGHINSDAHPLLSHELRQIKRPLEREAPESPKDAEVDTAEAIDQVGSLYATFIYCACLSPLTTAPDPYRTPAARNSMAAWQMHG